VPKANKAIKAAPPATLPANAATISAEYKSPHGSKSDNVSDAIIRAAEKGACDLIVMASHGRRGIKRLLLGSETQHVLTHASLPVLVLR